MEASRWAGMRASTRRGLVAGALALAVLCLGASQVWRIAAAGAAEAPATFGKTTVGASSDTFISERKRVNRYALPAPGSVTKLSIYLAPTATSGQQLLKGIIYADTGTAPGALLGVTEQLTFKSTSTAGWYDLVFSSPVKLAAGNYWIGVMTGATAGVTSFRFASVSGSRDYNVNTYASGPTNPFGSVTSDGEQISLYATYTPTSGSSRPVNVTPPTISGTAQAGMTLSASPGSWTESPTGYAYQWQRCDSTGANCSAISGAASSTYTVGAGDVDSTLAVSVTASNSAGESAPAISARTTVVQQGPATFGKTSVGALSDHGTFANYKIVHAATLPVNGLVTKLSVYAIPGTNSPSPQALKAVIYSDSGGSPGALVATGTEVIYRGNSNGSGWFDLPFAAPVALSPGTYWLGFITGASTLGMGYAYDRAANSRAYNANTYTSGPTNPFGSSTKDSEQASLYATYTPQAPSRPQNVSPPTITGTAQQGQTLTEHDGTWTNEPTSFAYQWQRCDSSGANCAPVSGATAQTYVLGAPDVGSTMRVSVIAINGGGSSAPAISAQSAVVGTSSGVSHLEYVLQDGVTSVYDMDHEFKLLKTISLPQTKAEVRGVTVAPSTHLMFIPYGGDGPANGSGNGSVLAYDLLSEKVLWNVKLNTGIDSGQVSPDAKKLYIPTGENTSSGIWNVLNAENGAVIGTIQGGSGAHNTVASNDGGYVYLAGRTYTYLDAYETATGKVKEIGPLTGTVRPFTVNGSNTLAFTTATNFDGFQVSSITTGKVLFTVSFGAVPKGFPFSAPSHGIALSPDEKRLYVIDAVNKEVQVWDVSKVKEGVAPAQIGVIPLAGLTGNESPCIYDCKRGGWLQLSLDGRLLFVGDSGEVIGTATRKVLTTLSTLAQTKKSIEVDWQNGVPIATSGRTGVGYVG
jgi:hypothetical protein